MPVVLLIAGFLLAWALIVSDSADIDGAAVWTLVNLPRVLAGIGLMGWLAAPLGLAIFMLLRSRRLVGLVPALLTGVTSALGLVAIVSVPDDGPAAILKLWTDRTFVLGMVGGCYGGACWIALRLLRPRAFQGFDPVETVFR